MEEKQVDITKEAVRAAHYHIILLLKKYFARHPKKKYFLKNGKNGDDHGINRNQAPEEEVTYQ